MKKMKIIVIGAGNRGRAYTQYALKYPEQLEVVAVAEPMERARESFKTMHSLPDEMCFNSYEELLAKPKMADYAFICTQDKMHFEPSIMALNAGYNLLLEKPIAPTAEECLEIARVAKEKSLNVTVCHVLRYAKMYKKIKEIVDSGVLGDIVELHLRENVGNYHMSHSFVRGNWHKEADSNPMIIAKCCHDLDLIRWLMGMRPEKISSFGSLTYFNEAHAPEGSPKRCTDGCPKAATCRYYAPRVYLETARWCSDVVFPEHTDAEILEKLSTDSPYGICVYHNDNDVVDHQTVSIRFSNGAIADLTMTPFRYEGNRETIIAGTNAELRADTDIERITVTEYMSGNKTFYDTSVSGNHFGGDMGLMADLVAAWQKGDTPSSVIDASIDSHLMAWAAEDSRHTGKTVDFEDYLK